MITGANRRPGERYWHSYYLAGLWNALWSTCPCCKDGANARHPLFTAQCNMITGHRAPLTQVPCKYDMIVWIYELTKVDWIVHCIVDQHIPDWWHLKVRVVLQLLIYKKWPRPRRPVVMSHFLLRQTWYTRGVYVDVSENSHVQITRKALLVLQIQTVCLLWFQCQCITSV